MLCLRRPCTQRCRWCKNWKNPESKVSFETQTEESSETVARVIQDETFQETSGHSAGNAQPTVTCNHVKLEPVWTRKYLREQQDSEPGLRVMLDHKQSYTTRPLWETVCPYSKLIKALWTQWKRLEVGGGEW